MSLCEGRNLRSVISIHLQSQSKEKRSSPKTRGQTAQIANREVKAAMDTQDSKMLLDAPLILMESGRNCSKSSGRDLGNTMNSTQESCFYDHSK